MDAESSAVIKYSSNGQKLMTIHVGGQPHNGSPFNGTTDVAFGPHGWIFITDGYGNDRVLEYTSQGKRVKQWGSPGEFRLPHAIQIDEKRTIYVGDRENGRIEKFDLDGNFLAEIPHLGRMYSLELTDGVIWSAWDRSISRRDRVAYGCSSWIATPARCWVTSISPSQKQAMRSM